MIDVLNILIRGTCGGTLVLFEGSTKSIILRDKPTKQHKLTSSHKTERLDRTSSKYLGRHCPRRRSKFNPITNPDQLKTDIDEKQYGNNKKRKWPAYVRMRSYSWNFEETHCRVYSRVSVMFFSLPRVNLQDEMNSAYCQARMFSFR